MPEFSHMSGGQAIENAASKATDPNKFYFEPIYTKMRDCQFSFAGLWNSTVVYINKQEKEFDIGGSGLIPSVYDLCAAAQLTLVKHICLRTQRAMKFITDAQLMPQENRTLVREFTRLLLVLIKCI